MNTDDRHIALIVALFNRLLEGVAVVAVELVVVILLRRWLGRRRSERNHEMRERK